MERTKAEKGITLIALIITIIVLLILAVVTIQAVQEHGIIGYAKQAQTEYDKKAEEENATLQSYAGYMDEHFNSQVNKGDWQLSTDGTAATSGEVTLKIGDYVDYTYDTVSTGYDLSTAKSGYTSEQTVNQQSGLKWRVLGVNENGCLTLISDKPTTQDIYFKDEKGYNNGVYLLNDICAKQYSNTEQGITARSLTIEDIEDGFSDTGKANRDKYTSSGGILYGKDNSSRPYGSGKNQYPILYAEEKGSGTTGTIKAEGIGASESYYTEEQLTTKGEEKATASENLACTQTYYRFDSTPESYCKDTNFYNLIFGVNDYYWVASRCVSCNSSNAGFGLHHVDASTLNGHRLFDSEGGSFSDQGLNYALRPAVSLGSNVTVKQCGGENSVENMHTLEKAS